MNEFGALEVITDETDLDGVKKATATTTWMVPIVQEGKSCEIDCLYISTQSCKLTFQVNQDRIISWKMLLYTS